MSLEESLRRKPVKQRPRSGRGATYSMQKKIAVVTQVLALGNMRLVADLEKSATTPFGNGSASPGGKKQKPKFERRVQQQLIQNFPE